MQTEFIIVGQGISGTFLSYYLQKEQQKFIVIDSNEAAAPSRIAAGIINPVTGRRMVTVWMGDEILPFAREAFREIGNELNVTTISQKNIIDFFPNVHHHQVFVKRIEEGDPHLHSFPEQNQFTPIFNFNLGCGEIRGVYLAHLQTLLPEWKQRLKNSEQLHEEVFNPDELFIEAEGVRYRNITASKIIFCDGLSSFQNPNFKPLPFAPNKGEALIVEIPGLPAHHIYKKGFLLVPMATEGLFWFGSNYQWNFEDPGPTNEFYKQAEGHLKAWLKIPFKILEHWAGLRPATLERRPFVGLHPHQKNIAILNGMGTKGCSLAPFFARQLTDLLLFQKPITPAADIKRFSKILQRQENLL